MSRTHGVCEFGAAESAGHVIRPELVSHEMRQVLRHVTRDGRQHDATSQHVATRYNVAARFHMRRDTKHNAFKGKTTQATDRKRRWRDATGNRKWALARRTCLVLDEDGDEERDAGDDVEREDGPATPDPATGSQCRENRKWALRLPEREARTQTFGLGVRKQPGRPKYPGPPSFTKFAFYSIFKLQNGPWRH